MRNKLLSILFCLSIILSSAAAVKADSRNYTVAQAESFCDGIVAYYSSGSYQDFIDSSLCGRAGISAEFYAIAVSQRGSYDFSRYEKALLNYLGFHEIYSASSRLKYALALLASGSTDGYIARTADEAIGKLGIMSLVFGLHVLNNGCTSKLYTADGLVSEILSRQLSDGGWAISGSYGDVDVTAMTLQALAPHYYSRYDVQSAVDSAVSMLSRRQLESGGFSTMNTENCESAAQVVTALSSLGIDPQYDSRFSKSGGNALSAMLSFRSSDGSFSHAYGEGFSESATCQAFYALAAYLRMQYGQGPLYVLDNAVRQQPSAVSTDPPSPNNGGSGNSGSSGGSGDSGSAGSSGSSGNPGSGGAADPTAGASPGSVPGGTSPAVTSPSENSSSPASPASPTAVKPTHGAFQPTATDDEKIATADSSPSGGPGYKLYAIIGVIGAAGIACLVLFLLKKRGKKHFITVLIIAAAGVVFILLTNFQSVEEYRDVKKPDGDLSVTMTIRCDTITGEEKVNSHIPDDGIILPETEFGINEGETVYDVLLSAAKRYGIQIDNRGAAGTAYIAGINYLYEFDYGDLSGWMYRVNGEFPEVGCQSFTLSGGDRIEWLYTTDIGKDLE